MWDLILEAQLPNMRAKVESPHRLDESSTIY